jgi:hypothetical protein
LGDPLVSLLVVFLVFATQRMRALFLVAVCGMLVASAVAQDPTCVTGADPSTYDLKGRYTSADIAVCQSQSQCGYVWSASTNALNFWKCITQPGTSQCCVDDCYARLSPACLNNPMCMLIPGAGQTIECIRQSKVCAVLSLNATQCSRYSFCEMQGSTCVFKKMQAGEAPPGVSVADACPAMHPVVIAMLALMFATLLGAIGVVGFVVWRNQRKADEEDERRAQIEAAAAEAKRARATRNRL